MRHPGLLLVISVSVGAVGSLPPMPKEGERGTRPPPVTYRDVTAEAGITFHHTTGASGHKYMPETMGAGLAFLDYNRDDWMDILLVNSAPLPGSRVKKSAPSLYQNNRDGTFTELTNQAGLEVQFYGMGAAVGDYDNDGFPDLYVTALGPNRLFHNRRNGTFQDVTAKAGVGDPFWGTSAAWLDVDNDGWLDLFVCNYVRWSPEEDKWCGHAPGVKNYCTPEIYPGSSSRLYRNLGTGRFEDVTERAGVFNPEGKALGVALWDFNEDGLMDLVVAEDTQPDKLYINLGNFRFKEKGVASGLALSESGLARAGMGIDAADSDNNGGVSVAVSNFSYESVGFYRRIGPLLFADYAMQTGIGLRSLLSLGFGLCFLDYDLDGWQDLLILNGHIDDRVESYQTRVTYQQRPLLFRNLGQGQFQDVSMNVGGALSRSYVGRGLAVGDYDNDGDLDLLISENGGPAHLLRNDGGNARRWFKIMLEGTKSNRDGIGALVTLTRGNLVRRTYRRSGSSYLSQSDPRVTFGLGDQDRMDSIEVRWPSGTVQHFQGLPANTTLFLREGDRPVLRRLGN